MSQYIPHVDFGGSGEIIHFAHANGFPVRTYQRLIDQVLPDYRVVGMNARPMWSNSLPENFRSWETAADDLIRFLDEKGYSNLIGMGHSFGAICTLIAADKRPDLFSKLVLIEPVVLPRWFYIANRIIPTSIVKKLNPIVKKTLARKDQWADRNEAFAHMRNSKLFAKVPDPNLWDYINSVTVKNSEGVTLSYPKAWEAKIFLTVNYPWKSLFKLKHPTLIIKGETSDTIQPAVWDKLKSSNIKAELVEISDAGHLVPLEKTAEVASSIKTFIASV